MKDDRARKRIAMRLVRLEAGLLGDAKWMDGIGELRIGYGPGYHLYFMRRGQIVCVMLCGGDKSSQKKDIASAKKMAKEV